ncbi:hypothetical protein CfE428DRAFT_1674 [Chthoniobacter flavus Ellin428]|uniref:Glutaredoxin domain-containing protein n=1 Tax=Chthoniobacter flavus Ellin428 TaxID=497964 RepID=B4CYD6_9BACT|nr:hypothetical protein [Chthoniobacter flavus]EDY20477.1 hypothetical protein CfE428DRAFT_1674 [Chthoniobacter flavus Ellin428]TCO85580.1 hypothetical protein EV701_13137 [Chthoniobacter flavus]
MKSLIVLLAVCSLGYAVDHWQELAEKRSSVATVDAPELILYSSKAEPACVRLEAELKKQGIRYQRRDLTVNATRHELNDELARVGKRVDSVPMPVAEIGGVLYEGVTFEQIVHRLH